MHGAAVRGLCPREVNGGRAHSPKLFPKYWALSSGGWARRGVITLSALSPRSCWYLRRVSKYSEVYYLPKFCPARCLLRPGIFASEFLRKPGFCKINDIMFGTLSRKISLRIKASSTDLIPSSHRAGLSPLSYWWGFPHISVPVSNLEQHQIFWDL